MPADAYFKQNPISAIFIIGFSPICIHYNTEITIWQEVKTSFHQLLNFMLNCTTNYTQNYFTVL